MICCFMFCAWVVHFEPMAVKFVRKLFGSPFVLFVCSFELVNICDGDAYIAYGCVYS